MKTNFFLGQVLVLCIVIGLAAFDGVHAKKKGAFHHPRAIQHRTLPPYPFKLLKWKLVVLEQVEGSPCWWPSRPVAAAVAAATEAAAEVTVAAAEVTEAAEWAEVTVVAHPAEVAATAAEWWAEAAATAAEWWVAADMAEAAAAAATERKQISFLNAINILNKHLRYLEIRFVGPTPFTHLQNDPNLGPWLQTS